LVKGGQKPNQMGPLVELVSNLDSNNIKIPGIKPVDDKIMCNVFSYFITVFFFFQLVLFIFFAFS
jgi:ATP-dependent Zn protease